MQQFLDLRTASWTVRATGSMLHLVPSHLRQRTIPASIPGCIHTDLLRAGLIKDPYLDQNEREVQWISDVDWQYEAAFQIPASLLDFEHLDLVCEGLDTAARIEINGQLVGTGENMYLCYRFDAKKCCRPGENTIRITFTSPNRYALEMESRLGVLPYQNTRIPFNYIRKMACNFGWDWGPVLTTCGVWLPIRIEAWNTAYIHEVRPLIRQATAEKALLDVCVSLQGATTKPLLLTAVLVSPDAKEARAEYMFAPDDHEITLNLEISNPQRWWPRGYGSQPLYRLQVFLRDEDGTLLDEWEGRTGLRTVHLRTEPDAAGLSFVIEVNDQPIFCKGANWIPSDCFPSRLDEQRYRTSIQQAVDANLNMLRVWGGGFYEKDIFYQLCDEQGILVWQDFMFACACYPEQAPFPELIEAEIRYQVARLCQYTCVTLWCGNNENLEGYWHWGWKAALHDRAWGAGYYFDLFPKLLDSLDPTRPYWPTCPYSGSPDRDPNQDHLGTRHIWDVYFKKNYTAYRDHRPRFCSEFGFQGVPTYATLQQALVPEELQVHSAGLAARQKFPNGHNLNAEYLEAYFEPTAHFDSWHYLMQLQQARALTTAVEWFRSLQPECMGTLYWQFNDCWPTMSFAAVDGYGRLKPLWYATRRFYAPRLLTIQPAQDVLNVHVCNDSSEVWQGNLILSRITFEGIQKACYQLPVYLSPYSSVRIEIDEPVARAENSSSEMIMAQLGDQRTFWFFDVDKNLDYPEPSYEIELIDKTHTTTHYQLTAHTLLRDVIIAVDRLDSDAFISDQLLTILPGETTTFQIHSKVAISAAQLSTPPVFQSVNNFGRRQIVD